MGGLTCFKHKKFRGIFNGLSIVAFLVLLSYNGGFKVDVSRWRIGNSSGVLNRWDANRQTVICSGLYNHTGYETKCDYLKGNPDCNSGGFFNYVKFFYCDCQNFSVVGYFVMTVWLITLFYLLGNTAADYFCSCLERLSNLLHLPPTVAGVTLLPLGNGAPDVFASIAAFVGRDSGEVGLNSVLGGAVFVVCVVVGTVSLFVAEQNVRIDKKCFVRDVCFFLFALVTLLVILLVGEVSVAGAVAFVCIYVVYAVCVAANELIRKYTWGWKLDSVSSLLPIVEKKLPVVSREEDESVEHTRPLLDMNSRDGPPLLEDKVPHWLWSQNVAIYSNEVSANSEKLWWSWDDEDGTGNHENVSFSCSKLCSILGLPIMLARRLTIPIVDEDKWSKGYAVASVSLAPLVLAFLYDSQDMPLLNRVIVFSAGAFLGIILGVLAFVYTTSDHPPRRFLLPWVMGGFFMSIIWFYMVAGELVALLVSFGVIFSIKPSLLALTILAWGNSMGDLMSNVAMAMNGGDGIQIAMSGCYAGPMFNTLAGLGISLLIGAWSNRPAPYIVPRDPSLYSTIGFVIIGLLWSLVILPWKNMRPTKLLGLGLMAIYLIFLSFRASFALGEVSLNW